VDSVFDALSHPTRRRILEILKGGAMSAGDLADAFPVSKPTMSAHFAKLKAAGLIQAEQRGTTVLYSLNLSVIEEALMGFMGRLNVGADKPGTGMGEKG
jgi:DNA-binding transcriptional ArsR family regulator